jgi:hypothetical protein
VFFGVKVFEQVPVWADDVGIAVAAQHKARFGA